MKTLLFMGFGGFIGTLLRFGVGKLYPVADKSSFPINTFIVKNRQKKHPKILTIIGDENIGKSRISKQYLNSLQK